MDTKSSKSQAPLSSLSDLCRAGGEEDSAENWDLETDVFVIGYGAAGASAAITAHDDGARVLIVEKMDEPGGNTRSAGGGFIIPEDAGKAYEYLSRTFAFADDEMDEDLVRTFCQGASRLRDWFERIAPEARLEILGHANFPNLPFAETITKYRIAGKRNGGQELMATLRRAVEEKRQIPVLLRSPALELVREGKRVAGAFVRHGRKALRVRARRGVILACGGYEFDRESLRTFCPGKEILALGNPGNTGDGLRMAASMGARMWHMTSYSSPLGVKVPDCCAAVFISMQSPNYFVVNQSGSRFFNESGVDFHGFLYAVNHFDPEKRRYPSIPCYVIFDEAARRSGRPTHFFCGYAACMEGYRWSSDSSEEIRSGVVKTAATIEGLAKEINVPAANLKAQLERWNADIRAGKDKEFGRPLLKTGPSTFIGTEPKVLSAPLSEAGPYYAIEAYPALLNTQGGPKRDSLARVVDVFGRPIPHLFAAGELGSIWGTIYQGSSNICEALVFGQIAGEAAALGTPTLVLDADEPEQLAKS